MWNPNTNHYKYIGFGWEDIDTLMEQEIIDADSLGYAMNNQEMFERVLNYIISTPRGFSYGELVRMYLDLTEEDIIIEC